MKCIPLKNLFDIQYGNSLELNRLKISDNSSGINFVSRTSNNNGVSARVEKIKNIEPFEEGLITVSVSGNVLEAFLQPTKFYTAYHVMVLKPLKELNVSEKLFYCYAIRLNKFRYNYGRQANRTLKDLQIPNNFPNWVNTLTNNILLKDDKPIQESFFNIDTSKWKWFVYDELFEIVRGKGARKTEIIKNGKYPFITSIDNNNGYSGWTNNIPKHTGNVISVNRNGSVGEAFYQPIDFCSTEDVHIFNPKFNFNSYIAFFLIPLIKKESYRYNYGRKWGLGRMKESMIKLPVNSNGKPDWKFMENYIKSLPYSKYLE